MELTSEQVGSLAALLGVETIDTAETLLSAATTTINELRSDNVSFLDERDTARTELSAAQSELETANAKVTELSAAQKPSDVLELSAASADVLTDRVELAATKIDNAVQRGDIPKFLGDKLQKAFAGDDPNLVMLSRDPDTKKSPLDELLVMLSGAELGIKADGKSKAGTQIENPRVEKKDEPKSDPWADRLAALTK